MKLNLLAAAVVTSFAIASTANAQLPGWDIGVAGGWAHMYTHGLGGNYNNLYGVGNDVDVDVDVHKNGYAIKAYGEYNFNNWFGLGLGYNYINGQKVKTDVYVDGVNVESDEVKVHAHVAELYGKFAYTFDDKGSDVFFKVGPTYNWANSDGDTDHHFGAVTGVGAQYAFTKDFAVRVGYDYFFNVDKYKNQNDKSKRVDEGVLYLGFQFAFGYPQPVAPAPKKAVRVTETHTLDAGILFPFDSSKLSKEGQSAVATVVSSANKLDNAEFEVYGYTDRLGSDSYNLTLSQKRADAVSAELANNGVNAKVSEGRGKANPVTGNKCDTVKGRKAVINCLAPDRRVEVVVSGNTTETK